MPTKCKSSQLEFEGFARRCVIADFQGGPMTSDAGTLLLRHTDRAIGLIDRVAACFVDYRMPELVEHQLPSMVGQRIVGVALGYEDISLLGERVQNRRAAGCFRIVGAQAVTIETVHQNQDDVQLMPSARIVVADSSPFPPNAAAHLYGPCATASAGCL